MPAIAGLTRTAGLQGERAENFAGLEDAINGGKNKPRQRMRQSADGKSVVEQIRDVLKLYLTTVTQLFRDWDDDQSGTVSKDEFRRALPVLGLSVERADADNLFDSFDADGSGELDLEELSKHLRAGAGVEIDAALQAGAVEFDTTRKQGYALRKGLSDMQSKIFGKPIDIDPESDVPVIEQLQAALGDGEVLGRVIDIFREWDEDGSGEISKREFAKAMSILGVSRAVLDELFDVIDADGSGHIDYREIHRKLRKKVALVSRKARAAKAMAMNEADAAVNYAHVRDAAADALDARQELIRLQRQLMLFERKEAAKRHRQQKRAEVAAIRSDMDRRVGRDLVAKLAESDIPIATDPEVTELSKLMNEALKMVGDADGCHGRV
jgi:Ca2+-binding EF-hand superfamily protein